MLSPRANPLPGWMVLLGSAGIAIHLFAILILAIAAPSGPWPTPFGTSMALDPPFASEINNLTSRFYLQPLHMTHNYHFVSNRTGLSAVRFDVHLKDKDGNDIETLTFPQEKGNFWVRHRQGILASALGDDQPVQPPRGEVIPAPGQKMRMMTIWAGEGEGALHLKSIPEHLVPKDRPVFRPTEWSQLLAKSYMRYLARKHGAAKVELIRRSREPISPAVWILPDVPAGTFEEMLSNFGEFRLEE